MVTREVSIYFKVRREISIYFRVRREISIYFKVRREISIYFRVRREVSIYFKVRREFKRGKEQSQPNKWNKYCQLRIYSDENIIIISPVSGLG